MSACKPPLLTWLGRGRRRRRYRPYPSATLQTRPHVEGRGRAQHAQRRCYHHCSPHHRFSLRVERGAALSFFAPFSPKLRAPVLLPLCVVTLGVWRRGPARISVWTERAGHVSSDRCSVRLSSRRGTKRRRAAGSKSSPASVCPLENAANNPRRSSSSSGMIG